MATGKRTTQSPVPSGMPGIPVKPTVVRLGELMSEGFSDGAYALRDALVEIAELMHDDDSYRNNEHRSSVLLAARIAELIERGGDFRAGAIAAIANWLVSDIADSSKSPTGWKPLEALPAYDGGDWGRTTSPRNALGGRGRPVSVTPDLVALRWGARDEDACRISVEVVRAIGRPISRRRFDAMRVKLAA